MWPGCQGGGGSQEKLGKPLVQGAGRGVLKHLFWILYSDSTKMYRSQNPKIADFLLVKHQWYGEE